MNRKIIIPTLLLLFFANLLNAQVSSGGEPLSSNPSFIDKYEFQTLKSVRVPALKLDQIREEDKQNPGTRFAAPVKVNFNLENSGQWMELQDGSGIWRLKLEAPQALGLIAYYDDFYIPAGGRLFMYNEDKSQLLGAYTSRNNRKDGSFLTGMIKGPIAILEYYEPAFARGEGKIHIYRVDQAYHKANFAGFEEELEAAKTLDADLGYGTSFDCHPNINCPEGADWQNEKRGVCRILIVVEEGTGYCTGSLINNTSFDGTPYLLTAFHCQDGYTPLYDLWRFDFNFESPDCVDPGPEPAYDSVLGSVFRSGHTDTDFLLVEITADMPGGFLLYLNGWDRVSELPQKTWNIHHPRGDIKKINLDTQIASYLTFSYSWNNGTTSPPLSHIIARHDIGTFEIGSSGSPIFNTDKKIVGQLHGGSFTDCGDDIGYYGRFSVAWHGNSTPETRLKDWLDPTSTDASDISGMECPGSGNTNISGRVRTEEGEGIFGATVSIDGGEDYSVMTASDGWYQFDNLALAQDYFISVDKTGNGSNGVTTLDLIRITKHILGVDRLTNPYKLLAADVNNSGSITTLDLILIRKLILGLDTHFADAPDWLFFPELFEFTDPTNPFGAVVPHAIFIGDLPFDIPGVNFIGIKTGDVNDSVDPQQ